MTPDRYQLLKLVIQFTMSARGSMVMAQRRISVIAGGQTRPPVVALPVVSSAGTPWRGFLLEQHEMPDLVEFPCEMSFAGHLLGLNFADKNPVLHFREDGRRHQAEVSNGAISMRSGQPLRDCRQEGSCTLFSLLIEDAIMKSACGDMGAGQEVQLIPRPGVVDGTLRHLLLALVQELRSGCPTGRIFGESLVHTIAVFAARNYAVFPVSVRQYRGGVPANKLRDVIEYIESRLGSNLSVSEIAQIAGISPYYFARLFKQSTGRTLHQYVLERRIARAKTLLANRTLGLADIAASIGLSSQSHFTTLFKEKVGVPPGLFRCELFGVRKSSATD